VPGDKYLYDTFAYDSPLELENMLADMDEVVVYGKIPRCSISIPTITGGMYSPDFMYIVRKKDGGRELNIIVETKDVKGKEALRGEEGLRLKSAEVFFETICQDGYDVRFHIQMNNQKIKQIIDGALDREVGETVPKKD
jgi:type III restriction enzyme